MEGGHIIMVKLEKDFEKLWELEDAWHLKVNKRTKTKSMKIGLKDGRYLKLRYFTGSDIMIYCVFDSYQKDRDGSDGMVEDGCLSCYNEVMEIIKRYNNE